MSMAVRILQTEEGWECAVRLSWFSVAERWQPLISSLWLVTDQLMGYCDDQQLLSDTCLTAASTYDPTGGRMLWCILLYAVV